MRNSFDTQVKTALMQDQANASYFQQASCANALNNHLSNFTFYFQELNSDAVKLIKMVFRITLDLLTVCCKV